MAEATFAEASVLPLESYAQALALLDRAVKKNPDNPLVLSARGGQLQTVGRMQESIEDTRRAAELDPLSPVNQGSYILALAHAARIDAAREELRRLELAWPGSATLQELQFRFHLRFGDPRRALQMAKSLDIGGENQERFLIARAAPTKDNIDRVILYARRDEGPLRDAAYLGFMAQALGEFGRNEQLYEMLINWPNQIDLRRLGDVYFRPALRTLRQDPRFIAIASRAGLLDYWKNSGHWPDFCFEPDLPYDCKAEAAKLS